jgi:hypothetical protein
MKKNVFFALIALFCVSSHSAWAQYVKLTATDGTVSWIEIKGTIDGTNIEIYKSDYSSAIDKNTSGAIDLWNVWSESGERGTHYRVTSIGNGAFYQCSGLTSVVIPNSVTSIGRSAFESCSGLTSITIPNSVTSIGMRAFFRCKGMNSVEISSSLTNIDNQTFYQCSGLTTVVIPNSVTSIGESAFYSCGMTSVVIPNSVTNIGNSAFAYCSYLTSLDIPSSVTSIGYGAFRSCSNLTTAVIPSSVTSIGKRAFYNNINLLSIFSYITDVFVTGEEAFSDCEKATLYVPRGTVEAYKLTADWNSISKIEEKPQAFVVSCNDKGKVRMINVGVQFTNNVVDVIINDGTDNLFYFEPNDNCVLKQVLIDGVDVTRSVRYNELKATVHQGSKMIVIFDEPSYDVNGDGTVNITDVVNLVNFILGQ